MYQKNKNQSDVIHKKPYYLVKGTIYAYIFSLIMLFLLAFLLHKYDMSKEQVYVGIVITYIISTFISGVITGKNIRKNSWLWGSLSGAIYFIILIAVSFVLKTNSASAKEIITMVALCVGGGTLGGMLS